MGVVGVLAGVRPGCGAAVLAVSAPATHLEIDTVREGGGRVAAVGSAVEPADLEVALAAPAGLEAALRQRLPFVAGGEPGTER